MAAERQLVILQTASGGIEYIQTGPDGAFLQDLVQSGTLKVVRSKTLDGPYYHGLFDDTGRLRILVCRTHFIPKAGPYDLNVRGKLAVSENIETVWLVPGTSAYACVCTTT